MNMRALISSVRVTRQGAHEVLNIWSRGGFAGELVVEDGDGSRIASILVSPTDSPECCARLNADGSRTYFPPDKP
jgi:hypothetical protein